MKILVTGGTGNVGGAVVQALLNQGAEVRVLARSEPKAGKFEPQVEIVIGDMMDPLSLESAMKDIDKLFLLNAAVPEELTQALIALGIAQRAGVKHITYLSVFQAERFPDVPHFASKQAVEVALRASGLSYTILRPGYYMQNESTLKDALLGAGIYPMPLGDAGIAAVDVRDIAEAAAISLIGGGHNGQTYDLVGPTVISGPANAAEWSRALAREVRYMGHDFDQWEATMREKAPAWSAFDQRMMFEGYYDRGFASTASEVGRVTKLLGHAPRSYGSFVEETAAGWKA